MLSAKGRDLAAKAASSWSDAQRRFTQALGEDRWEGLRAGLASIFEALPDA